MQNEALSYMMIYNLKFPYEEPNYGAYCAGIPFAYNHEGHEYPPQVTIRFIPRVFVFLHTDWGFDRIEVSLLATEAQQFRKNKGDF